MSFSLGQYEQVFALRDAVGKPYVLIGGQAVNYWAEKFLAEEPELRQWLPFTSKDIDFHGNREDVARVANVLGLPAHFPNRRMGTALAGRIPFKIDGIAADIEFVRMVPGVAQNKIESWAITATRGPKEIRVLDPISLLIVKTNLAITLDQKERRDAEHLRILILCTRAFLRETLTGVEADTLPARGWLGAVERVLKLAESSVGKKASRKLDVDWRMALPEKEIATAKHRLVGQFRSVRLPQWLEKQTCVR
jgi:hypothetical protein